MKSNGKLTWHNEKRKLKDLTPFEHNPRQLTEKQYTDLKKSLEKFNLAEVPAIDKDSIIIAGHQRIKILSDIHGLDYEIDVRVPSRKLTKKEFEEYNIRSNKNTGSWDMDILANNFELPDLLDYGFTEKELDLDLWNDKTDEQLDDVSEVQKEAISKLGDLFLLDGRHRVLCGDSTKKEDVEKLMDGKKADMVFTDPPYGVNYEGGANNKNKREKLKGDETTDLYEPCCRISFDFSIKEAPLYLWHAGIKGIAAAAAAIKAGYEIRCEIIWHKLKAHYGAFASHYKQKHEPLYYCHKGSSVNWCGANNETTVWEIEQSHLNEFHPTQKPVALPIKAIKNHSVGLIADWFLGSGSTLIACEQTNRICYGMEIDSHYIDVILRRYHKLYPDKEIKCLNRSFDFGKLFNV